MCFLWAEPGWETPYLNGSQGKEPGPPRCPFRLHCDHRWFGRRIFALANGRAPAQGRVLDALLGGGQLRR